MSKRHITSKISFAASKADKFRAASRQYSTGDQPIIRTPGWKEKRARQFAEHMLPSELRLWNHLQKIPGFRPQVLLYGYIVDFYRHPLVVEVDGSVHRTSRQQTYDAQRDTRLQSQGLRVLRFSSSRLWTDLDDVLQEIHNAS